MWTFLLVFLVFAFAAYGVYCASRAICSKIGEMIDNLRYSDRESTGQGAVQKIRRVRSYSRRNKVSTENRGWAESEAPDNLFKGKRVVITGELDSFPSRDYAASQVKLLGGRVTSTVSSLTDILVAGRDPGPTKMDKVKELIDAGNNIEVLSDKEFYDALQDAFAEACVIGSE